MEIEYTPEEEDDEVLVLWEFTIMSIMNEDGERGLRCVKPEGTKLLPWEMVGALRLIAADIETDWISTPWSE